MNQKGSSAENWKGSETRSRGYILIRRPDHPRAKHAGRYVKRADLVLEKKLGRELESGEIAHHCNGVKDDDRPENLLVMTHSEHSRLHSTGSASSGYREDLNIDLIRELYRNGAGSIELAAKFGCSDVTIMSRIPSEEHRKCGKKKLDLNSNLIREEYRKGVGYTELAVKFRCSRTAILNRIPAVERRRRAREDLDTDMILDEYRNGSGSRELAIKFGCDPSTIMRRIPVEERRRNTKKDLDAKLIREEYRNGVTYKELAVRFGCSTTAIRDRIPIEERRIRTRRM